MSLLNLTGQIALVTGGSRGIGAATVRMLSEAGATVAFTYRTGEEEARDVVEQCKVQSAKGSEAVIALRGDVSNKADCERAVEETVARFGRLDCYVANAGIWPPEASSVREMTDEQWRRTLAVNLDGVFFGCRAALARMTTGSIVIVTSTAAQRGEAGHADYAASKGALVAFVKSLAVEAAPNVTVNSVAPGWVATPMTEGSLADPAQRRAIEAVIPLGHVGRPEDIAGPIAFLCSSLARHITGEIVNVNGGSVLCG